MHQKWQDFRNLDIGTQSLVVSRCTDQVNVLYCWTFYIALLFSSTFHFHCWVLLDMFNQYGCFESWGSFNQFPLHAVEPFRSLQVFTRLQYLPACLNSTTSIFGNRYYCHKYYHSRLLFPMFAHWFLLYIAPQELWWQQPLFVLLSHWLINNNNLITSGTSVKVFCTKI